VRWSGSLLVFTLAGLACGSAEKRPAADAATALATDGPAADATPDAAPAEAAPAAPTLNTVTLRPGDDKSLQHLECAMNAAGEAVAVWKESDADGKLQVWAAQLPREQGAWRPLVRLGARPTSDLDRVSATVDGEGRALAVWNELDGADAGVVAARFLPATGWEPPKRISPGWVLSLVGSGSGEATAWSALEGTPPTLVRFAPATGWQADSAFQVPRPGFFFASPLGRGVHLWNQPAAATPGAHELLLVEYGAGGAWTAPARLQEALPFDHPFPMINGAIARDGSGVVIWNRGGEAQGELWSSVSAQPGAWQPPHRLAGGEAPLWNTTLLARDGGDVLAAWESGSPPRRKVWAALRTAGHWHPAVVLGDGSELVTGALGAAGSAVVAWATPHRVYARRHTAGSGWGPPLLAQGQNGGVADLCAGIDEKGRGWILWINGGPQMLRAAPVPE
jgi:hypothetical protein